MSSLATAFVIFASWGLSLAVLLLLGLLVLLPRLLGGYKPVPSFQLREHKGIIGFSFANYVTNGLWRAPTWLLPVMVSNLLGGEANAYFYVSWAVVGQVFEIPLNASQSLFSEGSHREEVLARDFRRSLKFVAPLVVASVLVLLMVGDKLLFIFGERYSAEGSKLVSLLAIAAVPLSVNLLYLGVARVKQDLRTFFLVCIAVCSVTLGLSYALIPYLGIMAPGVAWLTSQCMALLLIGPNVVRTLSMPHNNSDEA